MRLTSFIHPIRTFLPCSGVGRHMNQMLLHVHRDPTTDVRLLFARQWLCAEGKLPKNCPLRGMPFDTFPWPENLTERSWKLCGRPRMDAYIAPGTDWIYCPMETYFPTRSRIHTAITLHDVHVFEPNLPWRPRGLREWQRWKWSRWVTRAFRECSVVFTVSEFSKRRMVELLNAPESKITVVGNGVDDAFFAAGAAPSAHFARRMPQPYVLTVGGLRVAKGGVHLLDLARTLAARGSDIQVVVAGPNDPGLAVAAGPFPNVHLLGTVPDSQLPGLLKHALALVFLSLYEGYGIPAIEAMAVGIPVIVSNAASLPEVVGNAGIVVEPGETATIADICAALLDNPSLRADRILAGRTLAATKTWDACAQKVLQTLRGIAP